MCMYALGNDDSSPALKVKSFCDSTYYPGDHLEAASPAEASFWPIHPTLDRLLQYKALAEPFGKLTLGSFVAMQRQRAVFGGFFFFFFVCVCVLVCWFVCLCV